MRQPRKPVPEQPTAAGVGIERGGVRGGRAGEARGARRWKLSCDRCSGADSPEFVIFAMKRVSCSAVGRLVGNNDDASRLVALGGVRVQTFRRVAFGRGYRARPVDMRELVDTTGDARSPVDALAGAPWASTRDSLRPVAFAALFATLAAATATALTARRRRGGNAADDATDDDDDARDDGDAPPADAPRRPKSATATADLHRALTLSFALVLAATAWLAIIAPRDHTRDASGRYLDVRAALAVVERLAPPPPRESVTPECARRARRTERDDDDLDVPNSILSNGIRPDLDVAGPLPGPFGARLAPASLRPSAAAHFRRGLMYRYGFNAAESRRAFLRAARAGGDCAACLWGVAYSLVPDVNDWRTSAARRAAGRAAAVAASRVLARKIVTPERADAKIRALTRAAAAFFGTNVFDHPFGSDVEDPNDGLDDEDAQLEAHARYVRVLEAEVAAYADAHGDDADLLAFLGEARMNLTPWRYWRVRTDEEDDDGDAGDKDDDGNVSNGSVRVEAYPGSHAVAAYDALSRALALEPNHPLAAHMFVHLTESLPPANDAVRRERAASSAETSSAETNAFASSSSSPPPDVAWLVEELRDRGGRGLSPSLGSSAAKTLLSLARGTLARFSPHLAHMASHHLVRVGRWEDAVAASVAAVRADEAMTARCAYPYGEAHTRAMLAFAAQMRGDEKIATRASADVGDVFPGGPMDVFANFTTAFYDVPRILTYARFGRWRAIRDAAVTAERSAVNAARDVPNEPTGAEGWTALVSDTPWGRAQWAYVMGLASAANWGDGFEGEGLEGEGLEGDADADAVAARSFAVRPSPADWLRHLRRLAEREVPDYSDAHVVEGLSTRGSVGPFAKTSPFRPWKRRMAVIAAHVLAARIASSPPSSSSKSDADSESRDWTSAAAYLRLAVQAHDGLPFMEPEHWYLPPRLCLGEALLRGGMRDDAAKVFREDLENRHPGNAWAREGLRRAEATGGDEDENENEEEGGGERRFVSSACREVYP